MKCIFVGCTFFVCTDIDDKYPVNPLDPAFRPAVKLLSADTSIVCNDSLTLYAIAVDSQGSPIEFQWFLDDDTANAFETAVEKIDDKNYQTSFSYAWPVEDTGKHIVQVLCKNQYGFISAPDTIIVIIQPGRPLITGGCDSVYTPTDVNDTLEITISAADLNGTISMYHWRVDSDTIITRTTKSILTTTFNDTGMHTVFVYVQDDDSLCSPACSMSVKITALIPIVTISPDTSVTASAEIKLRLNAQDDGTITSKEVQVPNSLQWIQISTNDTTIIAPPTEGMYTYFLRAKDNNGYYGYAQCRVTVVKKESYWDSFIWNCDIWN
jgi:hypothetical protein